MGNYCCIRTITHKEELALPQELITEVLTWLPVKSLMRFKCLSKFFCSIIGSHRFIKSHLIRFAEDRSHLSLVFPERYQISTNHNSAKVDLLDFFIPHDWSLELYGYCNGVFLLLIKNVLPALWNPSTRRCRILPHLPSPPIPDDYYYRKDFNRTRMGFGYDSSEDDYKVVFIFKVTDESQPRRDKYDAWILGLSSVSWRKVCSDFLPGDNVYTLPHLGYFADGDLHWLFDNVTNQQNVVVAFDFSIETFSIVTLPDYRQENGTVTNVNVLDGSLCISFFDLAAKGEALLYVRKKNGAESTWSLIYSVEVDHVPYFLELKNFVNVGVLGYSKEKDKIMLDLDIEYVVSYDLREKSFQLTKIAIPKHELVKRTRSFVESLVSVHAINS